MHEKISNIVSKHEDGIFSAETRKKIATEITEVLGGSWTVSYNPNYDVNQSVLFVFNRDIEGPLFGRSIQWKRYYPKGFWSTNVKS